MNLREGTRRLALLLGVAGAIVGGFASYLELQAVLSQKARHNRFEQLANLDDVQKERKCRLLGYDSGCFRMKLPPGAALVEQPNDWQDVPTAPPAKVAKREAAPKKDDWSQYEVAPASAAPAKVYLDDNGNPVPSKFSSEAVTPLASEVNMGEIKTINWSQGKDYRVESIETQDGQTLYPTTAPSR